jgi:hypothetical protein
MLMLTINQSSNGNENEIKKKTKKKVLLRPSLDLGTAELQQPQMRISSALYQLSYPSALLKEIHSRCVFKGFTQAEERV